MLHDVCSRMYQSFDENQELLFNKQYRPLNVLGCDYFYYLVSDQTSKKIRTDSAPMRIGWISIMKKN